MEGRNTASSRERFVIICRHSASEDWARSGKFIKYIAPMRWRLSESNYAIRPSSIRHFSSARAPDAMPTRNACKNMRDIFEDRRAPRLLHFTYRRPFRRFPTLPRHRARGITAAPARAAAAATTPRLYGQASRCTAECTGAWRFRCATSHAPPLHHYHGRLLAGRALRCAVYIIHTSVKGIHTYHRYD